MASNFALAAVLFLISFMFGCGSAATVVVGGSEGWRSGYNYTDWALKHGTFYINDTLGNPTLVIILYKSITHVLVTCFKQYRYSNKKLFISMFCHPRIFMIDAPLVRRI